MLTENADAHRMEGACPDVGGGGRVLGEHLGQTLLDLVCRLVGKGDGQNPIGRAGVVGKFGQNAVFNLGIGKSYSRLQFLHPCFVGAVGNVRAEVGVTVANEKGDAAHQHGGFSASRACQHQQGIVDGEHRLPLLFVESGIDLIKQGALGGKIAFFNGLHEMDYLACHGLA